MNSIELKNVYAEIGDFKLKSINLLIPKGVIVGVIGKNGAGKTTLFKTINGTHLKKSGEIIIEGYKFTSNEESIRATMAIVYDFFNVNPFVKGKLLRKIYVQSHPKFDKELFDKLVMKFNIDLNKRIGKLSFGMQKKLMMIFAISVNPTILLLDEPLIGIDPIDKQEFIKIIQTYMENENNTIIISSHQVEDIEKIADLIVFLDEGKITLFEEKETLLDSYRYVRLNKEDSNINYIINPIENSHGLQGIVHEKNSDSFKNLSQRASLEQIFVHLCAKEVQS